MKINIIKTILIASFALFFIACNNDKHKVKVTTVKVDDVTQQESGPEPPPPPSPETTSTKIKTIETKCYTNDGLSYATMITINFGISDLIGTVTSEDLASGKKDTQEFEGKMIDNKLSIKFKNTPPVIGTSSEWTNKNWTIEKNGNKEMLRIIFKAKNYDTNKWEEMPCEFEMTDCKK